jgi:DNA-binding NarL/FixJ family response regulator
MEVLRLLVEGKTNPQIGVVLGISKKTVEKHLGAVYSKIGVASRVEAAEVALRKGWI